ncbi:MAG: organic solvent tolerance protein OstA [Caulobacteraceae bacterium]|nr:organic solvent tolerance protein OstA [Caulobacteraceae bacterium]
MSTHLTRALLFAIGLGLAVGQAARAQAPAGPAPSNGPIDITADQVEVVNSECRSTWTGSAEALQGDTRLRAHVIRTYSKRKGADANGQAACGATDRIEADDDVYYVTPTQSARGDHAVYTADAGIVVMTGNVIVIQGKDVVTGDRLTIKTATHEATMAAASPGPGKGRRVRAVFYPSQSSQRGPTMPSFGAPAPAAPP